VLPRIGDLPAVAITRPGLTHLLKVELGHRPGIARNAKFALSAVYSWAMERCLLDSNPTKALKLPRSKPRERWLSEEELRPVWWAAEYARDYGHITRLLMLTGARREEIGGLLWTEVNLGARQLELPTSRVKNKRPHIIPLSELALAQLPPRRPGFPHVFGMAAGRPFQGWGVGEQELRLHLPALPHWTLHDLRRSFSTHMNDKGLAPPHVVEAVLNHQGGHKAGVSGTYNRAAYGVAKREALERWAAELERIVGPRPAKPAPAYKAPAWTSL
jgi:integrase